MNDENIKIGQIVCDLINSFQDIISIEGREMILGELEKNMNYLDRDALILEVLNINNIEKIKCVTRARCEFIMTEVEKTSLPVKCLKIIIAVNREKNYLILKATNDLYYNYCKISFIERLIIKYFCHHFKITRNVLKYPTSDSYFTCLSNEYVVTIDLDEIEGNINVLKYFDIEKFRVMVEVKERVINLIHHIAIINYDLMK